jgi:hypothetical protein
LNWAFELLELPLDADAASIKRAYARLLRTTRPDEDAEGFQRLHAAYKLALAHIKTQTPATADSTEAQHQPAPLQHEASPQPARPEVPPASAPAPTPTAPPPPKRVEVLHAPAPAIDLDVLANAVIAEAVKNTDREALRQWLERRPEFWSISTKQQGGHRVLQRLLQHPQAMFSGSLDALLQFFDLDHVLSGLNPLTLQELRTKQTTLWELLPENHRELARRMRLLWGSQPDLATLRKDIELLQRPFSWLRALRAALTSGRARGIGHLVRTLLGKHGRLDELPPSIDRHHAHFWLRAAATPAMTRQRFALGSWLACIAALSFASIAALLIDLLQPASIGPIEGRGYQTVLGAGCVAFGVFGAWLLYAGAVSFDYWQGLPESAPTRRPWLRRLAIPVLCAFGFFLQAADAPFFVNMPIALGLFVVTARRAGRRANVRPIPAKVVWIMLSVLTVNVLIHLEECVKFHLDAGLLFLVLSVWVNDMWRFRAHLNPKLARN